MTRPKRSWGAGEGARALSALLLLAACSRLPPGTPGTIFTSDGRTFECRDAVQITYSQLETPIISSQGIWFCDGTVFAPEDVVSVSRP